MPCSSVVDLRLWLRWVQENLLSVCRVVRLWLYLLWLLVLGESKVALSVSGSLVTCFNAWGGIYLSSAQGVFGCPVKAGKGIVPGGE
jgi:hypothetical protein